MKYETKLSTKSNYNYFGNELRAIFKENIYKISLETGFTCPTRDGTKGNKGCHYCGATGSHFVNINKNIPIIEQVKNGKRFMSSRYRAKKFIAYFQSFTSTYGDLEILKKHLQDAIKDESIVGLDLSTRPDCLSEEVLDVITPIMKGLYHWLEIGLESSHDKTLASINRGHSMQDFEDAYLRCKKRGLRVCVHVILGLPGETEEMMMQTVTRLIALNIDGIKFHNLHIVKNSVFEQEYKAGNINLFSLEEYTHILANIIAILPEEIIVHRLAGDAPKDHLIAPDWTFLKQTSLNYIENYLIDNNIYQGMDA